MKCESAHEHMAVAVWGELPDEQRLQLEQHLEVCEECSTELEGLQALAKAMSLLPVEEPSANLLARTRLRLEEALDALPRESWLVRFSQSFSLGVSRLRSAPVAASALLVLGLTAGAYGGYRAGDRTHDAAQASLILRGAEQNEAEAKIASVSSIVQEPNSENVVVNYNRLVPDSIHGSLDDPQIRKLLLLGAQNRVNPDVRDDSVGLLADECRAGHQCTDGPVRNALMVSLLYDKSPSVRLKALDGLEPYVGDDMRVRDAVLEALMDDPDAGVRTEAIGLLAPVEADSSVREVLQTVAAQDDNPHIRDVSQQVLNQAPQIQ
jgi:hypothetical protein